VEKRGEEKHLFSNMNNTPSLDQIRKAALEIGFDDVVITSPEIPDEDIVAYTEWLEEGNEGELSYMRNTMRTDPRLLLPSVKSILLFASNYKQPHVPFTENQGVVASYARGKDYHNVHRKRLKKFSAWIKEQYPDEEVKMRGFSDSAPLLEKALAAKAGLGFVGKNTLLIHRKFGTFFLISALLTNLELPYTVGLKRIPRCGSCTLCIDACPTQALSPYKLDASKCLSALLIESKNPIPTWAAKKNPGYIFGCDICQNVCPHNKRSPFSNTKEFSPEEGVGPYVGKAQVEEFAKTPFTLFGTPLKRKGGEGLKENFAKIFCE
jgi:epoxyqueuosine reductase